MAGSTFRRCLGRIAGRWADKAWPLRRNNTSAVQQRCRLAATFALFLMQAATACAAGPRYVTGPPFFTGPAGVPVGWKQPKLMYFTDPGDLTGAVNHATADALVAAAAGVWNLPVASLTIGRGGQLAEHVSGANVYLSSNGLIWPADVDSSNASTIPVAVIYDSNGSVTDTLLGAGASSPIACEENAVTETVDQFDPAGYIVHAILVLNGRCIGPAPEQKLQMQYKLERAFGRILGLAWSQTNDNVFTGTPQPTYEQANHWPIMHPLEILCGPYSYQCLPNAFTLRPDDVAAMVSVYPIAAGLTPQQGKQVSLAAATSASGSSTFPDGEGMSGVNVLLRREPSFTQNDEGWFETSTVTGSRFHTAGLSPFVTANQGAGGSIGTISQGQRGAFNLAYADLITAGFSQNEITSTEAINPLYIGSKSLGVYAAGVVAPAGSSPEPLTWLQVAAGANLSWNFVVADAPPACGNGADGTLTEPMTIPASGWWDGLLCGYGHASYAQLNIKAQHSLTVEVTALDVNGSSTTTKVMPVIGLFAPGDALGALPSLGVQPTAFNTSEAGTTSLHATPFATVGEGGLMRIGVADERGDGRPDFSYQERVFYVDSLAPSVVPATGGTTLTITGFGFRAGNEVLINGFVASVVSWTSTTIVATAPNMALAKASIGVPVDIEVQDLGTGATSTMTGALTYTSSDHTPSAMLLISAESAPSFVGTSTAVPFTIQMLAGDGVSPLSGDSVLFSARAGTVRFGACGLSSCSIVTDARGMAATTVVPLVAGNIMLQATDGAANVTASFVANPQVGSLRVTQAPAASVMVGQPTVTGFGVTVYGLNGVAMTGQDVTFTVAAGSNGNAIFGPCSASPCTVGTNIWGGAGVTVTPTAPGLITLIATDGEAQAQVTFLAVQTANILTLGTVPAATSHVQEVAGSLIGRLTLADAITPVARVAVLFSAPVGVVFSSCGRNLCSLITDNAGLAGTSLMATTPGVYTLAVTYGNLTQSVQLVVTALQPVLKLISAPTGMVNVGTIAPQALTAQLLDKRGNPWKNQEVTLGGPLGSVSMSCEPGTGSCVALTDANGMVTSFVTPLKPGNITLEAVYNNLVVQASFTSVGASESFLLSAPPPANVIQGSPVSFTLRAVGSDGQPVIGHKSYFSTTTGVFAYTKCSLVNCQASTNSQGLITVTGTGWIAGPVSISAVLDGITVVISFNVLASAESMNTLTAPSGSYPSGTPILPAFTVQVVAADGRTGVRGENVTFTSVGGAAGILACTMPCVVKTDASGFATTGAISVRGPGPISLLATDNALSQSAAFVALGPVTAWQVVVVQGGGQAASDGAALHPVVVQVTDGFGNLVVGATVKIGQTVRALDADCPVTGRCPAAAVLASSSSSGISDALGEASVMPRGIEGRPTFSALAFSAGQQGFATAVVSSRP